VTDTSGGLPPAGWYPDPYGAPHDRWWDGQQWSDHVNTPTPAEPVSQPPAFAEPAYQQPVAEQPTYEQPTFEQQAYEPQQYQAPEQQPYEPQQYQQPATQTQQPYEPQPATQTQQPYQAEPQYQSPQQFEQPSFAQPSFEQPSFAQPEPGQPSFAQPDFAQPAYGQPEFAQPEFAQPEFAQPEFAQPEFAQPQWQQPVDSSQQPGQQGRAPDNSGWAQPAQHVPAATPDGWPPQGATDPQGWQQPGAAPQSPEQPTFAQPAPEPFAAQQSTPNWADQAPAATPNWGAGAEPGAEAAPGYPPAAAQSSSSIDDLFPGGAPRVAQTPFPAAAAQSGGVDFGQLISGGGAQTDDGWPGDGYVEPPTNPAATASVVFGAVSFIVVGLASLVGIILGAVGLAKAAKLSRESGEAVGRGKAIAGIVLSLITLAGAVVIALFFQAQVLSLLGLGAASGDDGTKTPTGNSTLTANNNIPLAVGQQGIIADETGAPAITFTVNSIQQDPTCTAPEEDQLSAENGQFVAVNMTFVTSPTYVSVMSTGADMQMNSTDWMGYGPDGSELLNSDAGLTCLAAEEQLPLDIPAGTTTTGTYVLDLSTGATSISWSPFDVTQTGDVASRWEWPTVSAQ
jgi:hypothetical protein